MHQPRITISLPCYKRPQRTIRAIESILDQTVQDFELLITVDGDDDLWFTLMNMLRPDLIDKKGTAVFDQQRIHLYYAFGPIARYIVLKRNPINEGKWGTKIRNEHIQEATGKYFMFMGSDDVLKRNHLENILGMIEGTDLDFVGFDTWIAPIKVPRNTQLKEGMIGHSDIIIRTDFLKTIPPHEPIYGHDWSAIKNMMEASKKYKRADNPPLTYNVMSIPGHEEQGID